MYTLLGRVLLGLSRSRTIPITSGGSSASLTDPVVRLVALATPKAAPPVIVWLFGVVWLFWVRVLMLYAFLLAGALHDRLSRAMERHCYYIAIAFFGMINGMFHPFRVMAFILTKVLMTVPLLGSEGLIFYFHR